MTTGDRCCCAQPLECVAFWEQTGVLVFAQLGERDLALQPASRLPFITIMIILLIKTGCWPPGAVTHPRSTFMTTCQPTSPKPPREDTQTPARWRCAGAAQRRLTCPWSARCAPCHAAAPPRPCVRRRSSHLQLSKHAPTPPAERCGAVRHCCSAVRHVTAAVQCSTVRCGCVT
jgi:hypothetical protein